MERTYWPSVGPTERWNRLRVLRRFSGLSQVALAAGSGVSLPTISDLERGGGRGHNLSTLKKIASFFNREVEDIFPAEMLGDQPLDVYLENLTKPE